MPRLDPTQGPSSVPAELIFNSLLGPPRKRRDRFRYAPSLSLALLVPVSSCAGGSNVLPTVQGGAKQARPTVTVLRHERAATSGFSPHCRSVSGLANGRQGRQLDGDASWARV